MTDYFSDKTVLVPFDFSDQSIAAVNEALGMAGESARIHVLYVLAPLEMITIEPSVPADFGSYAERMKSAIVNMKKRINDPRSTIEYAARLGDPGAEIIDYAKKIGADVIVMPSYGRTEIKRLLLGFVAERVVRHAECPVMALRGKAMESIRVAP